MPETNTEVTLEIAGATLTVDSRELFRAWLDKHLGVPPAPTPRFAIPELNEGEVWSGIIVPPDGSKGHHLIMLPGDNDDADWQMQMDWAKSIGGDLPTRYEQALLFAFMRKHFKEAAYWSNESHASDASYAWCQHFHNGNQTNTHKSVALRARAFRRLALL